jgi:hypothetical protein
MGFVSSVVYPYSNLMAIVSKSARCINEANVLI